MVRWLLKWAVFDALGGIAAALSLVGALAGWWPWTPALLCLGVAVALKLAPSPLTNGTKSNH